MHRNLKYLFVAVLACLALSVRAQTCAVPDYPIEAVKAQEDGVSVLGFLVGADGKVERSVVLDSSGSSRLDRAAQAAFEACGYTPATQDGKPVAAWIQVLYVWFFRDDANLVRAKSAAAIAAGKGNLDARVRLGYMLLGTAKSDTDRQNAQIVLQSAADLGQAQAQFEVGRAHEEGLRGLPKDADAALPWYRKAAAQGDVLAIQRLDRGLLPPEHQSLSGAPSGNSGR